MKPSWRRRGEVLGQPPAELAAQRRRVFTVSNGISVLRVVALPVLLYHLTLPVEKTLTEVVALSAFIALTDFLDGFVARRLNEVSDAGRVIDPIADKICIGAGSAWLSVYRDLPVWIPAIIITRDILILAGSIVIARRTDIVLPSNQLGRITTVVLTVTLFSYVVDWRWPQKTLVWTSGALVVISLIIYVRVGRHILGRLSRP